MRKIDAEMEHQLKMLSDAMGRANRGRNKFKYSFKYKSIYEAILHEGVRFRHKPFTQDDRELLLDIFGGSESQPWRIKQCFYNSQVLSALDDRLGYAEGYVLSAATPIPILHGWAVLYGRPVDVTLRDFRAPDTCDPQELLDRASENLKNAYVGVIVDKDEVRRQWLKSGMSEAMLFVPEILEEVLSRGFSGDLSSEHTNDLDDAIRKVNRRRR